MHESPLGVVFQADAPPGRQRRRAGRQRRRVQGRRGLHGRWRRHRWRQGRKGRRGRRGRAGRHVARVFYNAGFHVRRLLVRTSVPVLLVAPRLGALAVTVAEKGLARPRARPQWRRRGRRRRGWRRHAGRRRRVGRWRGRRRAGRRKGWRMGRRWQQGRPARARVAREAKVAARAVAHGARGAVAAQEPRLGRAHDARAARVVEGEAGGGKAQSDDWGGVRDGDFGLGGEGGEDRGWAGRGRRRQGRRWRRGRQGRWQWVAVHDDARARRRVCHCRGATAKRQRLGNALAVGIGRARCDDNDCRDHERRKQQQTALAEAIAVGGLARRPRCQRRAEIRAGTHQRCFFRLSLLPQPLRKGHLLGRAHRPPPQRGGGEIYGASRYSGVVQPY